MAEPIAIWSDWQMVELESMDGFDFQAFAEGGYPCDVAVVDSEGNIVATIEGTGQNPRGKQEHSVEPRKWDRAEDD